VSSGRWSLFKYPTALVSTGFLLGIAFWLSDSLVDVLVTGRPLSRALLPSPHELGLRVFVVALFVLFGYAMKAKITQVARAEKKLAFTEKHYQTLVENLGDGVYIVDLDGRLSYVNNVVLDRSGRDRECFVGRNYLNFVDPEDREKARDAFALAARGEYAGPHCFRYTSASGKLVWLEVRTASLRDGDRIIGVLGLSRDVTERRRAEEALRIQDFALDSAISAIAICDLQGRLTYVNDAFLALWGYDDETEVLGRPAASFWQDEKEAQAFEETVGSRQAQVGRMVALRKDGSPVDLQVVVGLVSDENGKPLCMMGSFLDVTDARKVEEALRESEAKYRTLFEASTDAIFLEDLEGRILDCNTAACEMSGYTRDELIGLTVEALVPEDVAAMLPALTGEELVWDGVLLESRNKRKNGEVYPVEVSTRMVSVADRRLVIAYVRDITRRKEEEARRQRLEARVQHAQKLERLGMLAGGVAHDFNNLLMGILGNANLALSELDRGVCPREVVEEIELAASHAAELTGQLLAYSGKGKFLVRPLDLVETVKKHANLAKSVISDEVTIALQCDPEPAVIEADATQLTQVVLNLITNAAEAYPDGKGVVIIRTGVMQADRHCLSRTYVDDNLPEGQYAFLEVSDAGRGMDKETLAKIFDPFFSTKKVGQGLGLAAVLGIVRGHRGAINVDSRLGEGTTFRVLFPRSDKQVEKIKDKPPPTVDHWRGSGTILVADDESSVRRVVRRMLERYGFTVVTCADGHEAVAIFRERPDEILLVILDVTMPNMDGGKAFREIRRIRPDAKVILSSG